MAMKSPAWRGSGEHLSKGRKKWKEKGEGKRARESGGEKIKAQEVGKRLKQGEGQGETSKKKRPFGALVGHNLTERFVFPFHGFPGQFILGLGPVDGCQILAELLPKGFFGAFRLPFHSE
jgi:hypothetical protein